MKKLTVVGLLLIAFTVGRVFGLLDGVGIIGNAVHRAFAAEHTPDPRLVRIAEQRQILAMQMDNARLSFENAQLKLKELQEAEEKIKAEAGSKEPSAKGKGLSK